MHCTNVCPEEKELENEFKQIVPIICAMRSFSRGVNSISN